ncbi:transposable element Tcb1 transposase [Trichonephila clavipes]|nr:transposable element Tcb1 transposase [Trichonephila clavipes]
MLGRRIAARQPPPTCLPELRRALLDEWCNIPQDQIDNLILSMPRRSKACIASTDFPLTLLLFSLPLILFSGDSFHYGSPYPGLATDSRKERIVARVPKPSSGPDPKSVFPKVLGTRIPRGMGRVWWGAPDLAAPNSHESSRDSLVRLRQHGVAAVASGIGSDRGLLCHGFEPCTIKTRRVTMHVKSVES